MATGQTNSEIWLWVGTVAAVMVLLTQICKHIHHPLLIGPNLAWLVMTEPAVDLSGQSHFFHLRLSLHKASHLCCGYTALVRMFRDLIGERETKQGSGVGGKESWQKWGSNFDRISLCLYPSRLFMASRQNRKLIVFIRALNIPLRSSSLGMYCQTLLCPHEGNRSLTWFSVCLCYLWRLMCNLECVCVPFFSYSEEMVPLHPCLRLISNSEQTLSSHTSRRLITMEKIKEPEVCAHWGC